MLNASTSSLTASPIAWMHGISSGIRSINSIRACSGPPDGLFIAIRTDTPEGIIWGRPPLVTGASWAAYMQRL